MGSSFVFVWNEDIKVSFILTEGKKIHGHKKV